MNKPFTVSTSPANALIVFRVFGFLSLDDVAEFRAALGAAAMSLRESQVKIDVLADLRSSVTQSRAVADELEQSVLRGRSLGLANVACLTSGALARLQFARIAAAPDVAFFAEEGAALEWLRRGREQRASPMAK